MDRQLIKVYLFLLISFIAIFPLIEYKDIWITALADEVSQSIYGKLEDIEMEIAKCPTSDEGKAASIPLSADKAKIVFVLDDNWDTQYTFAYKILKQKKFPASIAVVPAQVGQPNYMTLSQLKEVYQNGWDLINHTYNHKNLSKLNSAKQAKELKRGTEWLNSQCFLRSSNIIAYPYGAYNQTTLQVMAKDQYRTGRSLHEGFENNQPRKTYLAKVQNLTTQTDAEQAKDWIDEAIAKKLTIIFVNHRFSDNPVDETGMLYDKGNFAEVVNYIDQQRNNLEVVTYSEWLNNKKRGH